MSFGTAFLIWQWSSMQAREVDDVLWASTSSVGVKEDKDRISFLSKGQRDLEVLFFPGALVDPDAYVPLVRSLAEQSFNVHIIKMPWRLSSRGYQKIKELFNLNDDSKRFVLGGHSQGGKMAAQFVYENPGLIDGLFLLGTSHPRDIDLSDRYLPTVKIFAEFDGLASMREVEENVDKLPQHAKLQLIEGGNHAQFAYIGSMLMDGTAEISRKEQRIQTAGHLTAFFREVEQENVNISDDPYLLKVCEGPQDEIGTPCGYADLNGNMIIPIGRYFHCYTDTLRNYAIVLKESGTCVAIDRGGRELYEVYWYDNGPDYLSEGLFRIKQNGKIGYADKSGTVVIPPQFECANPFEDGKARVALDCEQVASGEHTIAESDNWFYIDKMGQKIDE